MTTTKWMLDPAHSEVQFKIKHLVISTVTGSFTSFEGTAQSEGDDFANANIEFTLDVDSVNTNQEQRDQHLKAEDFFNAAQYPKISFQSTSFTKTSGSDYKLTGDLTIKDVTKPVTLDVEYGGTAVDFYGNTKAGFEVSGKINRKDYNLSWGGITEAGAIVLSDEVKLVMSVQFAKQAATIAA